jgi:ABC-2 type transport system ATP-binding protein
MLAVEDVARTVGQLTAEGASADEPAIVVEGLTKSFVNRRSWAEILRHPWTAQRTRVLHDVGFSVQPGEFFGVLGPNGAGKTTLFRVLTGMVLPDAGHVDVLGHSPGDNLRAVRRLIGTVLATDRSLYWRISARENMRLFAALHGMPRVEAERRSVELLELVKLGDTGNKMVGTFSSGMRQRLLIARALLSRPRILLLDEPTRSLDPLSAREFRQFLRSDVGIREGCTVLLATHSQEEAMELCDRVMVMHKGHVLATGPVRELQSRFGDSRYAAYVREPGHPAFASLTARALIADVTQGAPSMDGWTAVEMTLPGGAAHAELVLHALVLEGVSMSRFERVDIGLAGLLERVVEAHGARES